ncbi:MAG: peptidylprolyl isomerase [Planctomycetota bacterium]
MKALAILSYLFCYHFLLLNPLQNPAPAPQVRVAIDMNPAIWIDGDPLRFRLIIENVATSELTIPKAWAAGGGITARQTKIAPGSKDIESVSIQTKAALGETYQIAAGARLILPIEIKDFVPPPGDAFELLFLSSSPAAGSDALRVERVENLRGARARIDTQKGIVVLELAPDAAPLAARNFVKLSEAGFYDGQAFHRIAKGLCIQTGDPGSKAADLKLLPGTGGATFDGRPLPLERTKVVFERGVVGLARSHDPLYYNIRGQLMQFYKTETEDALNEKLRTEWPSALVLQENARALTSGTSQFFICTSAVPHFAGRYSAFAKVIEGMPVVDAIEASETLSGTADNAELAERPADPVRIRKITIQRK